ncbi:unnamed protein product [Closterium sp. Yama58-4]|nr:unnamed protein product [Closterium sp. Yama58-4]
MESRSNLMTATEESIQKMPAVLSSLEAYLDESIACASDLLHVAPFPLQPPLQPSHVAPVSHAANISQSLKQSQPTHASKPSHESHGYESQAATQTRLTHSHQPTQLLQAPHYLHASLHQS